jgi:subtilisin family serine protease
MGGRVRHAYRLIPAICAHLPEAGVQVFARRPGVVRIEADSQVRAIGELSSSWGVELIQAGVAHALGVTGAGVKVAIIDTGIDYNHPELSTNYAGGYDFVNEDSDPIDDNGHGTFVSGIIAATYNGVGVVGVAPSAKLYALKVLDNNGSGWWSDVIAALQWAVDHGIQVTNNSYGDDAVPFTVWEAFNSADAAGVMNVAAAGNSGNPGGGGDNVIYPAGFDSVIAVAAIDQNRSRASFSSTGPAVELSAPGVSVNSTTLGSGYGTGSGTSFSSPHVAGAAALVISAGVVDVNGNGRINDEVRAILAQSANDLGDAGRDPLYGWGMVNAARAAVPCEGDTEPDRDVDGSDLAAWIATGPPAGTNVPTLAANFGRTSCP